MDKLGIRNNTYKTSKKPHFQPINEHLALFDKNQTKSGPLESFPM